MARSAKTQGPAPTTPPPAPQPDVKPTALQWMRSIPSSVIQWAKGKPANPGMALDAWNPFKFPDHPPGVKIPEGMAMDQDPQMASAAAWAANALSSVFAEGVIFLGFPYLAALSQRAEYRIVTETIASEMTREWVKFSSKSGSSDKAEKIKELEDEIKSFHVQQIANKFLEGGGFFGRGHVYIDIAGAEDDDEELATGIGDGLSDLSKDKLGKGQLNGFRTVEAIWCYPTDYNSNNPLHPDWYRPKTWQVMLKRVHRSRLLTVVPREVPDLLKPAYSFGGLSNSQMMKPYVDNWLRTRQAVADFVHSFSVWVLATNMASLMNEEGYTKFLERMDLFNGSRDNRGLAAIDKDTETVENISAPIAGLDALQAQAEELMCLPAQIPIVKFVGDQPHGLNASSEGAIRIFYDRIKADQERILRDPLTTMFAFIQLNKWGEVDDDIIFDFVPLWQLDDAGKAAIQKTRADTRAEDIASGVITAEEGRKAAARDEDSPYQGLDLDKTPAPGPETMEPGEEGLESETLGGPQVKSSPSRLASGITSKAANFGGAVSGGFANKAA